MTFEKDNFPKILITEEDPNYNTRFLTGKHRLQGGLTTSSDRVPQIQLHPVHPSTPEEYYANLKLALPFSRSNTTHSRSRHRYWSLMHLPAPRMPTKPQLVLPSHRNRREIFQIRKTQHQPQQSRLTHQTDSHRQKRPRPHPQQPTLLPIQLQQQTRHHHDQPAILQLQNIHAGISSEEIPPAKLQLHRCRNRDDHAWRRSLVRILTDIRVNATKEQIHRALVQQHARQTIQRRKYRGAATSRELYEFHSGRVHPGPEDAPLVHRVELARVAAESDCGAERGIRRREEVATGCDGGYAGWSFRQ